MCKRGSRRPPPRNQLHETKPAETIHRPASGCCDLDVPIAHETFELIWLAQEYLGDIGEPSDVGSVIDRALRALIESLEERTA